MNNYNKLTKKELIDKLNEMEHLAKAIEVKDNEIISLQQDLDEKNRLVDELSSKCLLNEKLKQACDNQESKIAALNQRIAELEVANADYDNLKNAVEAKDNEIARITQEKATSIATLKKSHEEAMHNMQLELEHLRAQVKSIPEVNNLTKAVDELQKENNSIVKFVNQYINSFRNYLKVQQASLENVIELEGLLTDTIKRRDS